MAFLGFLPWSPRTIAAPSHARSLTPQLTLVKIFVLHVNFNIGYRGKIKFIFIFNRRFLKDDMPVGFKLPQVL